MRDHDDNRSGRVEDHHDLQGHGCPDVVPGGSRFCLRCAAFLGLFPCTRWLWAKISCDRQSRLYCATTMHARIFRLELGGGGGSVHGSSCASHDRVEGEGGKRKKKDSGDIPSSRHPAISHRRVSQVNPTSPRVPRCKLWPIARSFRRPRYRRCCASPSGVRVVCDKHWPSWWGSMSRQWAAN